LGGAAAGAVGTAAHLAGLFDPAPLEIVRTKRGLEVRTGRHVWSVTRDRFGERSRFVRPADPAQSGFGVRGAHFPGTDIVFDLDFQFEMATFACAGGWRMILRGNGIPISASVAFVPWLQCDVGVSTPIDSLATASLISRLTRGEASAAAPARLAFAPDLTWCVDADLPTFTLASRSVCACAVIITIATDEAGLFNGVLGAPPTSASTNLLFRDIEPARRGIAFGWSNRQTELSLVPESIRSLGIQTFDTNLPMIITGAEGTFRAVIERSGLTLGGIETGDGLVLLGRHGSERFNAASLPIAEKPHLVLSENSALTLHGEDLEHRLEADARDGRLELFVARGALTNLAAAMEGADYVRLDFSGTEAWLKLGDVPAAANPPAELDVVSDLPVVLAQVRSGEGVPSRAVQGAQAPARPAQRVQSPARPAQRVRSPARPAQRAQAPAAPTEPPKQANPPAPQDLLQVTPLEPTVPNAELPDSLRSGIAVFNLSGPGGYELSLDGAKLRLVRGEDLLSLTFRFRGLTLVGPPGDQPYIADEQTSYACKAKPRTPLLIVEFPPQHVAEEAFFRLVETDPVGDISAVANMTNYPDVPLDITNVPRDGLTPEQFDDRVETEKEKRDPSYAEFRAKFMDFAKGENLTNRDTLYFGGKTPLGPNPDPVVQKKQATALAKLVSARQLVDPNDSTKKVPSPFNEPLKPIARARLSGPSRLVFRLPCRDGHGAHRKVLDFTAAALTDWSQFDLSVVRRAERLFKENTLDGLPEPETDFATILKRQFIFPNQTWQQRRKTIMEESGKKPDETETAIELPFRLFLSPDQTARFRTPEPRVATKDPRPIALWHAELDETQYGSGTRAIWSPDYYPGHFAKDAFVPERGPVAPWYPADKRRFRASISSYDRHELVALTSVHGIPVLARKPDSPVVASVPEKRPRPSNFEPPPDFAITDPAFLEPEGIYVPPPLDVNEMTLTALGGSLDLDTRFEPPASPYAKSDGHNLFNAFSIERWKHRTTLGRDVAVEVVYKGFLYPLGNRASLVKVTERKFLANPHGRFPTAYLIQRMFIRVGKPLKKYPGIGQPFESRDYPVHESLVLTKRTPDILDPTTPGDGDPKYPAASIYGRLKLRYKDKDGNDHDVDGLSFWPRTKPELGGEVRFKIQNDGSDAMSVPLLFCDNTAIHNTDTMFAIAAHYESLRLQDEAVRELCTAHHAGAKRRYAPEKKTGEATFETDIWRLGVRGRLIEGGQDFTMDAAMEGQDQPPFYPYVAEAAVKLRQVDNFTGNGSSWVRAGFAEIYVRHALAPPENPAQLYLQLIDQVSLDVSKSGDRAGGVAKPNGMVLGLSIDRGVITGRDAGGATPQSVFRTVTTTGTKAGLQRTTSLQVTTPGTVTISDGRNTHAVPLSGLVTVQNLMDAINNAGLQVTARLSSDGRLELIAAAPNAITVGGTASADNLAFFGLAAGTTAPLVPAGLPSHPGLAAAQSGRFDPSEFFGGALSEAKLLGILPLKDVIRIVGILAAPQLKEAISYAKDGFTADETVRKEIRTTAGNLQALIAQLRTSIDGRLASLGGTLEQLYPNLSRTLDEFQASLDPSKLDLSDPETFIAAVSPIVESGRRVIAELERIAADPTPLFVKEAIQTLAKLNVDLRGLATTFIGQLVAAVRTAALQRLKDILCNPDAPMLGLAVFGPALETACRDLDPSDEEALAKFVKEFRDVVQAETEDVARDADAIKEQFQQQIDQARDAAEKAKLEAQRDFEVEKAQAQYQALQAGEAMFFDAVARPLLLLLVEMEDLAQNELKADAAKLLSFVNRLFDAADVLARGPAIQKVLGTALQACDETRKFLDAAFQAIGIPKPDEIRSAARSLQDAFSKLADLETKLRRDISTLPAQQQQQAGAVLDAVSRFRTGCAAGVDRLAKTLLDALDARTRVDTTLGQLCPTNPADSRQLQQQQLAFAALQQLFALRLRAIGEITDLFRRVAAALDPSPGPASASSTPAAQIGSPPSYVDQVTRELNDIAIEVGKQFSIALDELAGISGRIETGGPGRDDTRAGLLQAMFDRAQEIANTVAGATGGVARVAQDIQTSKDRLIQDGKALGKEWGSLVWPSPPTPSTIAAKARQFGDLAVRTGILTRDQERNLVAAAAAAITVQGIDIANIEGAIDQILSPALDIVSMIYTTAAKWLGDIYAFLTDQHQADFLAGLNQFFKLENIAQLFNPGDVGSPPKGSVNYEQQRIDEARDRTKDLQDRLKILRDLGADWKNKGGPALIRVGRDVEAAANKLLHGNLSDLIDVAAIRHRIEDELIDLIPVRYDLTYDFNTHVGDLGELFKIDRDAERTEKGDDRDLVLSAHLMINLLKPSDRSFKIKGALQPFKVKLLPILDAVTLSFAPATFTSTDGSKPKFDVKVANVEIGPALDFLQPLAEILSPGGKNGFFIHPQFAPPGIEAGFGLDLGTLSLGPVSFLNISLNASCELPFDDRPAHFRVSLSRRDSPFLMSYAIYGGGGFFALIATSKGIVGFEAAFETGAVAALHYGPLDAQGRVSLGIYISKNELSAQIGGYFFAGGAARIAIFAISVALTVTIIQTIGGDMQGDATFAFSFSMGLCNFDYSVPVAHTTQKGFGGGGGGAAEMIDHDGTSIKIAALDVAIDLAAPPMAEISRKTNCMSIDWNVYRTYFDDDL
jgi:hypothetical protein